MQTVNFRCGHCGNLMAVAATYLGQQVRCPHCQQVVTAPATSPAPVAAQSPTLPPPPPPPVPTFNLPQSVQEQDSIFAPPDADEDLFGAEPTPRLELPPDPVWPQPAAPEPPPTVPESQVAPQLVEGAEGVTETVTWMAPPSAPNGPADDTAPAFTDASPAADEPGSDVLAGVARPVREIKHNAGGNPWILPLVILPLISYSVLVTVLLAMAYSRQPPPHPLEMQRDDDGSNPGARKAGKERVQRSYKWHRRQFMELPEKQRVALGNSLTVGDLRVTPLAAELRKVMIETAGFPEPDPSPHPTLVLHLELENVSSDVAFYPLDPYFDRRFEEKVTDNAPFTYLEVGSKKFYGGAAAFGNRSNTNPIRAEALQLHGLDGDPARKLPQNARTELLPGEKMRTFVACNADSKDVAEALEGYEGPLLYRVRLRRGLVPLKDEEVSASTVIGVELTGKDVKRSG